MDVLNRLKGQLVVSCQAGEQNPFHGPMFMAAFAWAAELGGAGGLRVDKPSDVEACKRISSLPLIGIYKVIYPGSDVYITPTFKEAKAIAAAGADMLAVDGTPRPRPEGAGLAALIKQIHEELGLPVMADCSTVEDGVQAAEAGADVVASTMAGYTEYSRRTEGPDVELVRKLVAAQPKPVIAEGRYSTPAEAGQAIAAGALAVVVGTAITVPQVITSRFAAGVRQAAGAQ